MVKVLERAVQASLNAAGPGYLAYIPGGGIYAAALADFVANGLNRYTGMSAPAPALFRLEQDVLAWLCANFGYGPKARAVFTPGGSPANLAAVIAARHEHFGDAGNFERAVVYTSTQAHHSIVKAVRLAGIPPANVRAVAVDDDFRMRTDALEQAIRDDRKKGLRPFLVIAAAGTTNTGAVNPLGPVADVTARESLWLHVDGAYGGAFVLCEEGGRRLRGIERADSITFDPHKGMFLPYGTGCLLVADGHKLRRRPSGGCRIPSRSIGGRCFLESRRARPRAEPRLPRPTRVAAAHAPRRGRFPRRSHRKARAGRAILPEASTLSSPAAPPSPSSPAPQLSTVAFRLERRGGEPLADYNRRNVAFLAAINARQHVHLSSTLLPVEGGMAHTSRVCVLSFRTHARHMDKCLEDVAPRRGVEPVLIFC